MVVIVDYGMGNLGSILNMLRKIGTHAIISSKEEEVKQADKLILPGVGAFDNGITSLTRLGLTPHLDQKVLQEKTPTLGICLGMQLFGKKSEEGRLPGLGWIDAEVRKFQFEESERRLKIPHMGWNVVKTRRQSSLFNGLEKDSRFYFAHSYHVVCSNTDDPVAETVYGHKFTSSLQIDNILGVQFHPEKSHKFGMTLLRNFIDYF